MDACYYYLGLLVLDEARFGTDFVGITDGTQLASLATSLGRDFRHVNAAAPWLRFLHELEVQAGSVAVPTACHLCHRSALCHPARLASLVCSVSECEAIDNLCCRDQTIPCTLRILK
jgi:hypothetical protein